MAENEDRRIKEDMAKGMSESGKKEKAREEIGTGEGGADELTEGMSEAGRHPTRDAEEIPETKSTGRKGDASR